MQLFIPFQIFAGNIFNPSELSFPSGKPAHKLEALCKPKAVETMFADWIWTMIDGDGLQHPLLDFQGIPDCGKYDRGLDILLYAWIVGCRMFRLVLCIMICRLFVYYCSHVRVFCPGVCDQH